MGTTKEGCGGLWEQIFYQGLDPQCKRVLFPFGFVTCWQCSHPITSDNPEDSAVFAVNTYSDESFMYRAQHHVEIKCLKHGVFQCTPFVCCSHSGPCTVVPGLMSCHCATHCLTETVVFTLGAGEFIDWSTCTLDSLSAGSGYPKQIQAPFTLNRWKYVRIWVLLPQDGLARFQK